MKKLAAILIFCLFMAVVAIAMAEVQTVVPGDGASIPYLNGFESNIISDQVSFAGITGAVEGSYVLKYQGGTDENRPRTITLQNLAVTDDFYAVFFKMTFEEPISFPEGRTQYLINEMVPPVFLLRNDGSAGFMHLTLKEAHLTSDWEMLCMFAVSLEKSLPAGQALTIGGIPFKLYISRRKDPTISCTPMLSVKSNPFATPEDKDYNLTTVIERVAFTPLGTRIVVNNQETGSGICFRYAFANGKGDLLSPYTDIGTSSASASPEHPAWTRNETWCLGSCASNAIQLIPAQNNGLDSEAGQFSHIVNVPIGSLPSTIPLEGGGAVHIQDVFIEEDGFLVSYTTKGYTGYISIDLTGEGSKPLNLNFVSFTGVDLTHGLLQAGGFWSSEYKGKRVTRVSAEDLEKVKELSIHYVAGVSVLKPENAVIIKLEP